MTSLASLFHLFNELAHGTARSFMVEKVLD